MITKTLTACLQGILNAFGTILNTILKLFPKSPFLVLNQFALDSDLLKYLNYLLPINEIVVFTEAWLVCVGVYMIYSAVARWVKLID